MNKDLIDIKVDDGTLISREPSKTRVKREMEELQRLGIALTKINSEQLESIELPDILRDAINLTKKITSHGALRRHYQYIGKLMRGIDGKYIKNKLDEFNNKSADATRILHQAENWRDKLLKDDAKLSSFILDYPHVDISELRALIRIVRKELVNGKNLNYRKLYQLIRDTIKENK